MSALTIHIIHNLKFLINKNITKHIFTISKQIAMNVEKLQKSLSQIRYIHERRSHGSLNLYSLFETIVTAQPLEVNRSKMESILNCDLKIITNYLDRRLVSVLCEALAYYTSMWPGWLHLTTDLPLQESLEFEQFRQHLINKCNHILQHASEHYDNKTLLDKGTQTDSLIGKKELAPYDLVIGGTPTFINNLAFTKRGDDIIVKQHTERPWRDLTVPQFLNWPHVSVSLKLPDISLTRANRHKVHRYIALDGDTVVFPEIRFIDYITKIKPGADFKPYSYLFFFYYFLQLNIVLQKIPKVSRERLNELAIISAEFLNDIKEMSVCNSTMSTHTKVGFNIGKSHYIRSKKMVSRSKQTADATSLNFYEVIIPQVDVSLNHFTAVQDQSDLVNQQVTFQSLNALANKLNDSSNPELNELAVIINNSSVSYGCVLCDKCFAGPSAYTSVVNHFRKTHKSEQMVLCYTCGGQFYVEDLTDKRWTHDCVPK